MSCFIVSSCFIFCETIGVARVTKLFHFAATKFLKLPLNRPQLSIGFIVSVVSIYMFIRLKVFEKVFPPCQRERKIMLTGRQDYTIPGSSSFQSVYAACRIFPDARRILPEDWYLV